MWKMWRVIMSLGNSLGMTGKIIILIILLLLILLLIIFPHIKK